MIPVRHPDGGTMLLGERMDVLVSYVLPSGRPVHARVPAAKLSDYLGARSNGTQWEFTGVGGQIRRKGKAT